MLTIRLKKPELSYAFIGFSLTFLFIGVWFLPNFFKWDINLFAGLLLAPYICNVQKGKFSLRYLLPTLLALLLAICIPVKTFFFIALIFSVLLMIENCLGKLSYAFLLLAFLISPVFKYLIAIVDFPIRLWITTKVVDLLNVIGLPANAAGNIIELDKYNFAVDPACAGLNMLIISLIICLFLLVHYQKQTGKNLSFMFIIGLFTLTIGLNILSNYFRILLLVVFKIMPDTFFHEFVGIACLLLYVLLPLMFIIKPIINFFGKPTLHSGAQNGSLPSTIRFLWLHLLVLILTVCIGLNLVKADTFSVNNHQIEINGFKKKSLAGGILKFENKESLVYIKPTPFYVPGHDPKLCWTGSGWTFENIQKETIAGVEMYTALLTKKTDKIYAAWWFDDGNTRTVNQILWRWTSAKYANQFYLVNVNALNKVNLTKQVSILLSDHNYLTNTK
jgi:exosortase N